MSGADHSMPTPSRSPPAGFTLIELLVVIGILAFLMGMLMPLVGLARRSSLRTVSLSIMAKTEAALYQYKADYRAYPYQLHEAPDNQPPVADVTYLPPNADQNWTNALAYNVGTDIAASDQLLVKADMQAAAALYGIDLSIPWAPKMASMQSFTNDRHNGVTYRDYWGDIIDEGDPAPVGSYQNYSGEWVWAFPSGVSPLAPTCVMLNRLGQERANECMLCGDINAGGVNMQEVRGGGGLYHRPRDLSGTALLSSPKSANRPGWAKDYLRGEIDGKYLRGDAILDAYLHPLIYICQVTPGVIPSFGSIYNSYVDIPWPSVYGLAPDGRKTLEPYNPGTTTVIAGDQYLPDPTNLMHSDMRAWAPPGYELEFELWSAGPDGQMSWWRDDAANADNIPCEPYNKGIGAMP
jgi:prepilin-type N-terminal cleavage/methylation domain-containing protein